MASLPSLKTALPLFGHASLVGMPNWSKPPVCATLCLIHRRNGLVVLYLFGWDFSIQNQEDNNIIVGVGKREYTFIMGHAYYVTDP